ncbi:hypothetical protein FF011L_29080 [Roseimaritima multifibrata]|uniref:Uncharacterized protein n=1 Tax=Roseimaritima multifibrata TaxID=1930274 RepID=A0A517MGW9_9BACT|nr:hypothetical protein FF011L_29080 [Roseimaritima multifibrata]
MGPFLPATLTTYLSHNPRERTSFSSYFRGDVKSIDEGLQQFTSLYFAKRTRSPEGGRYLPAAQAAGVGIAKRKAQRATEPPLSVARWALIRALGIRWLTPSPFKLALWRFGILFATLSK